MENGKMTNASIGDNESTPSAVENNQEPAKVPATPAPSKFMTVSEHRHLRRSHQPSKHRRKRHRDLTPEEDSRRRQRWALLYAVPFVLIVVGFGAWVYGASNIDEYLRNHEMILTGKIMLGIGVAGLLILFVRGWVASLKKVIWEWRHPPQDTGIHWTEQGHRRRRRRRLHSTPAAPATESTPSADKPAE